MRQSLLCAVLTCLFAAPAAAQEPSFPDAPRFESTHWVQGKPTGLATGDTIYVVELWATWCGPCQRALPKLAKLQQKHAQTLRAITLTDDDPEQVRRFISDNAYMKNMDVVVDTHLFEKFARWPGVQGIPTAFLVQSGKVLWRGHPGDMSLVLSKALAGRWTPKSESRQKAYLKDASSFLVQWNRTQTRSKELLQSGKELVAGAQDHPRIANELAWSLLTEVEPSRRPLTLALKLAQAAYQGTSGNNYAIVDTYARALYLTGDRKRAVELQKQSNRICKEQKASDCGEIQSVLAVYLRGAALP